MLIETLAGGMDKNLAYLAAAGPGQPALVVDAAIESERVLAAAEAHQLSLELLVLTHSHPDHIAHAESLLAAVPGMTMAAFGREAAQLAEPERFRELAHGDRVTVGELELEVRHTPGHYPDSICLIGGGALFSGDTLFIGRTGRTVGERSDTRELYRSIAGQLTDLPGELVIYPGHDYGPAPCDTLDHQRQTNPFLQAADEEAFVAAMAAYEASRG